MDQDKKGVIADDVADEEFEMTLSNDRKRKFLCVAAIAGVAVVCLLVGLAVMKLAGLGRDAAETNVTQVTVPAVEEIDASGCKPNQWSLQNGTLVYRNCARVKFSVNK